MRLAVVLMLAVLLFGRIAAHAQDATTWPHTVTGPNGATVEVYQPQAISWPDEKTLTARMALAITPPGGKMPILGTIVLSFATTTDNATRLVSLADPKLTSSHFPSLDTAQAQQFDEKIAAVLRTLQLKQVPLDAVAAEPEGAAADRREAGCGEQRSAGDLPCRRPASLVVFDGEPVMAPAGQQRTEVCRQHQLARVHRPRRQRHVVPAEQRRVGLRHRPPPGRTSRPSSCRPRSARLPADAELRRRAQGDAAEAGQPRPRCPPSSSARTRPRSSSPTAPTEFAAGAADRPAIREEHGQRSVLRYGALAGSIT